MTLEEYKKLTGGTEKKPGSSEPSHEPDFENHTDDFEAEAELSQWIADFSPTEKHKLARSILTELDEVPAQRHTPLLTVVKGWLHKNIIYAAAASISLLILAGWLLFNTSPDQVVLQQKSREKNISSPHPVPDHAVQATSNYKALIKDYYHILEKVEQNKVAYEKEDNRLGIYFMRLAFQETNRRLSKMVELTRDKRGLPQISDSIQATALTQKLRSPTFEDSLNKIKAQKIGGILGYLPELQSLQSPTKLGRFKRSTDIRISKITVEDLPEADLDLVNQLPQLKKRLALLNPPPDLEDVLSKLKSKNLSPSQNENILKNLVGVNPDSTLLIETRILNKAEVQDLWTAFSSISASSVNQPQFVILRAYLCEKYPEYSSSNCSLPQ